MYAATRQTSPIAPSMPETLARPRAATSKAQSIMRAGATAAIPAAIKGWSGSVGFASETFDTTDLVRVNGRSNPIVMTRKGRAVLLYVSHRSID